MKVVSFFILIIVISSFSFETPLKIQAEKSNQKVIMTETKSSVQSEYANLLIIYINALINTSEPTASNGLKWKKFLNLPVNNDKYSQYYTGSYFGVAGIGDLFIDLYKSTNNETYISICRQIANYLIMRAYVVSFGVYWSRSEDVGVGYTSEKYGIAGIASFLLSLYELNNNQTILNYALKSLDYLYNIRLDTAQGYAYGYDVGSNSPITDLIYGGTGIAKTYLQAYQITSNKTYLDICLRSMAWVLNQTQYNSNAENGLRRVLYSTDPSYPYFFTGYQSGASGIGDFLLTLYNFTGYAPYLLYAKQMANWLVYKEGGKGYWDNYNAVEYVADQANKEGTFLGYSAGSAGVGLFLLHMFQVTKNSTYLGPVERIKNFLIANELTNGSQIYWKAQLTGTLQNSIRTDLSTGVAGIGLFFITYYNYFGTNEALVVLNGINEFFGNITTKSGLVPSDYNSTTITYDSSYFQGLTGIATFFLEVNNSISENTLFNASVLTNIPQLVYDTNTTTWIFENTHQQGSSTDTSTGNSISNCFSLNCSNPLDSQTASFVDLMYSLLMIFPLVSIVKRKNMKKS